MNVKQNATIKVNDQKQRKLSFNTAHVPRSPTAPLHKPLKSYNMKRIWT